MAADFETHFREQYPSIVSELTYVLGDYQLACDVVQDAFARQCVAWSRLSRYDKPGAWVRRVALRIAGRARWRRSREVALPDGFYADSSSDVDRRLDVRRAVANLPPKQATAIVYHYYRDLPIAAIAPIMGCRETTVKSHLHHGRKRLAELLADYAPRREKF